MVPGRGFRGLARGPFVPTMPGKAESAGACGILQRAGPGLAIALSSPA